MLTAHIDEIYKLALEEKSCIFIAKLMYVEFNYINPNSMQIRFNVKQAVMRLFEVWEIKKDI